LHGVPSAFFLPLADGRFRATSAAAGPWDPAHLHGGPPAALLGRAVEAAASWPGLVCRLVFDILRPVPVADLEVATRVVRPGRRIELLEAELLTRGEPVMTARAWRIRTASPPAPVEPPPGTFSEPAPPVPSGGRPAPLARSSASWAGSTGTCPPWSGSS